MDPQETLIDVASSQPDEYARSNDLSVDSQVNIFPLFTYFQKQNGQLFSAYELDEAENDVAPLDIPYIIPRTEQLSVSKDSLELLRKVASLGREDGQALNFSTTKDFSKFKLEPPLLPSDPEYDCRDLARCVQELKQARIDLRSVPLEPLNTSNDESLDFPETANTYRQKLIATILHEKIDISKETLRYLPRTLRDDWTDEEQANFLDRPSCRKAGS